MACVGITRYPLASTVNGVLNHRRDRLRHTECGLDAESKLLVDVKQWENARCERPAAMVFGKITYCESLPDHLFELKIPEGATVVEE